MQTKVYDEVKTNNRELAKKENQFMVVAPRADIYETKDHFTVLLEMPGVTKDGLKVYMENHHLVIEGISRHDAEGELVLSEIFKRNYRRFFKLSSTVNTESIEAKWQDGILQVKLAKLEAAKPKEITIQFN
ncbi:Hsp20/alpha crystallin family protein [bacterium]|nr:Hsp20/alpha crystallin family protein [bacterium]